MSKVLLFLSFVCLAILLVGTALWPNAPAFWLASGNGPFQLIRGILMATLFAQLVTNPPRHMLFRLLAGSLASVVGLWALGATYSNQMQILDGMGFLGAAIAIGLTALERKSLTMSQSDTNKQLTA